MKNKTIPNLIFLCEKVIIALESTSEKNQELIDGINYLKLGVKLLKDREKV